MLNFPLGSVCSLPCSVNSFLAALSSYILATQLVPTPLPLAVPVRPKLAASRHSIFAEINLPYYPARLLFPRMIFAPLTTRFVLPNESLLDAILTP